MILPTQYCIEPNKFKNGNTEVFNDIVKKYREKIYNLAFSITHNHSDADDLSQEIFLKLYFCIAGYNEKKASFYTWLYRISINHILKWLKRNSRIKTEDINSYVLRTYKLTKDEIENKERKALVETALDSLPIVQRVIVVLYEIQEYSHKEIAGMLGCAVPTVRWHLFMALRKLRRVLMKKGELNL